MAIKKNNIFSKQSTLKQKTTEMSKNFKKALVAVFIIAVSCTGLSGQGNLLVTPVRVIFDGQKQKEDLNITNVGNDSAVFIISFIHHRMNPDGSLVMLQKGDSLTSAEKYLRVFPRRIKLGPNESQTIRLQYRKVQGMAEREYRSHLYFRADKKAAPLGLEDKKRDSTKMAVQITAIFGISIPVIIRNGNLTAQNSITDVALTALTDSTSLLKFQINRSGNRSSYGNLKVVYTDKNGKKTVLTNANGVGVYPEIPARSMSLLIRWPAGITQKGGNLNIMYNSPDEEGGETLASTEYILPG